jgi:7,8-dihydropterin-6-yl-methyl-4-(beta-D-ribofuranosyl)aminobenzene 5'-phosphate synthase
VLLHNMELLGADPTSIDALALSHSHYDHTGGLPALLPQLGSIPLHGSPDLFTERYACREGEVTDIGLALSREEMAERLETRLSAQPTEILPGIHTTGEITGRQEAEGRSPHHMVRRGDELVPDPYRDDLSLVLEGEGGLTVLCGCCHAGLLNTLAHVKKHFEGQVLRVIGGLHLKGLDWADLVSLIERLRGYGVTHLYPNHCSGRKAMTAFEHAFGTSAMPCDVGAEIEIGGS